MDKRIEERDPNLKPVTVEGEEGIRWYDGTDSVFTVRGLPWFTENDAAWLRLPKRAEGVVREPVWGLAQCTAGARLCFRSDTTRMLVDVQLRSSNMMSHMPLTGSSGVALYAGEPGHEKPWPVAFPAAGADHFKSPLFEGQPKRLRTFTLYLPLYNGVNSLLLGLDEDARIEAPPSPALPHPVVFYGTSITQGGCAHNPGADYPTIVGRKLNLDVVNLGFSGNGKGEPEVADLLAEIDASAYVLDYVANAGGDGVADTLPNMIDTLRAGHPETPIIIMSRILYSGIHVKQDAFAFHERQRDICLGIYADRRRAGDQNLHFIDGNSLIPYGTELAYSDSGVHPSNVGFQLMADRVAPQLEMILLREPI